MAVRCSSSAVWVGCRNALLADGMRSSKVPIVMVTRSLS